MLTGQWPGMEKHLQAIDKENAAMTNSGDRPFDWVASLAFMSGAAVIVVSLAILIVSLISAAWTLIQYLW